MDGLWLVWSLTSRRKCQGDFYTFFCDSSWSFLFCFKPRRKNIPEVPCRGVFSNIEKKSEMNNYRRSKKDRFQNLVLSLFFVDDNTVTPPCGSLTNRKWEDNNVERTYYLFLIRPLKPLIKTFMHMAQAEQEAGCSSI